jgi:acetyltransferase-like isoleucine patch superfamily enzyme
MKTVMIHKVEDLCKNAWGGCYIYGAKTIAMRVCKYLQTQGMEPEGFLVSKRYDNPTTLLGKEVLRIEEEEDRHYDCVVVAVNREYIWDVKDVMEVYADKIERLLVVSPSIADKFPNAWILSGNSVISENTFIPEDVQIVVDETSTLVIEDEVEVGSGSIIWAENHSVIHIKKGCLIGEKVELFSSNNGQICVGENCEIRKETQMNSRRYGNIQMAQNVRIGHESGFIASNHSKLCLAENVRIGWRSVLQTYSKSHLAINKGTNINEYANITTARGTDLHIGEDNMISRHVLMETGTHKVISGDSEQDITNRKPIKTGNHVWVGMRATLMPGCDVGDGSIVGANTFVNKEIPAHCSCGGYPAKILKENIRWER